MVAGGILLSDSYQEGHRKTTEALGESMLTKPREVEKGTLKGRKPGGWMAITCRTKMDHSHDWWTGNGVMGESEMRSSSTLGASPHSRWVDPMGRRGRSRD